ncbi:MULTISPECIES: alpha/beta hydrolase family protein [Pseudonocardia]|uniref:Alpha/beta hydrolase family protein n=2 Tax=Pseudonocardia TaxID=1847 RepID=A0A1Y2MJ48_PSEAH|nr:MULTISPECIES: prolyl oligopeptidase family serine peptidase [Pseudonocardia]OSY35296.1 Alpha/beta hydrolase family protein [Pseudonocardia autotrophica]TDN73265.1 alpha/beta hydrolase family protein [Pseudonocardia autotrophica]BBG04001.1 dipeptidyl aminopeptidase [Pseudonocardia autotrophica]GEC27747.1 dipeptidyl aminopeptidase [Pseudonocardia saturnea]
MTAFFKNPSAQYSVENALGQTYSQATDAGEILSTIARIPNGDSAAWVREWTATADRLARLADAAASTGHLRSAAARWLRASSYYAQAAEQADATGTFDQVWERHRDAWDHFVDRANAIGDIVIERITVPFEDTTLPGYLFRTPGEEPRRTLIHVNGSDGSVIGAWAGCAAAAPARGWTVVTVDGPGQNAALVRQGIPFRPDWEAVLTPLIDLLRTRSDVDPDRIAVLGVSQGGFWVPRALAHEHRVAAAVVDPGVVDVSTVMLGELPQFLRRLLDNGERKKFDKDMEWGLTLSPGLRATLARRMRPYGVTSYYDFFTAALAYRLTDDELAAIRCPMLVTDPEHEQFWPGQSAQLVEGLGGSATLQPFTAAEGADSHCEPLAQGLRGERVLDWLDEHVPA